MMTLPFQLHDPPWDAPMRVLHDDGLVVVVDKPAGLISTGEDDRARPSVEALASEQLGRKLQAVHRLDRGTTGLQLLAADRALVAPLHAALVHDSARKEYLAWVHGACAFDVIDVDAPIGALSSRPDTLGVTADGRAARSRIWTVRRIGDVSLVRVRLFTGRTHQVRIHLAHLGHPLVGEPWYGPTLCELAPRPVLHAATLMLPTWRPQAAWSAPAPWRVASSPDRDVSAEQGS